MSPLQNCQFRRLFIARTISLLGTGIATIALAFLAYHLQPKSASLIIGTALVIKMVAYIALSPVFGHFAERVSRKKFLVTMDVIRFACLLVIPFVTLIWQIYVLIFIISVCSAGFTPVFQSVIPEILPDEAVYSKALILTRVAYNVEVLLSPALSALFLIFYNFHSLFLLNAITFLMSALLILTVSFSPKSRTLEKTSLSTLFSGVRLYLGQRELIACLCLILVSSIAGATVIVNTVVFFHGVFQQSRSITALATGCFGLGSVLFALAMPRLRKKMKETTMMLWGAVLVIITYAATMVFHQWQILFITWFLLGAGAIAIEGLLSVIVNRYASDATRAKLFSANFSLTHACWLIAYALVGYLGIHPVLNYYFLSCLVITVVLLIFAKVLLNKCVEVI
jgi:MFS family permease